MKSKVHKLAITVAASAAVASMAPSAGADQNEYGVHVLRGDHSG